MIELLAPAGDLEKLKFALHYGADAVYVGGQNFSLRANAKNFSLEDLKEAVTFAHERGKKVYVTVNIVFHEEDIKGLKDYLVSLSDIGIDAVIVSDVYVMKLIKEEKIPLEVHVSTQASILNPYAALFYINLGAKRVVLAREASKEDIKCIKDFTGLDLECFIHGAMCTSFSGRCVMSNVLTNRDANRGGCAQICRWTFKTDEEPIFSMTSKDLNMVSHIKEMMDIGVNSFKVEGRMRGIYYIATIIHTYRTIFDKIKKNTLKEGELAYYLDLLNRSANRDSSPQFFEGLPTYKEQYFLGRQEISNQDFLGLVLSYDEEKQEAFIEQRNYFKPGDIVEFFGPDTETFTYEIHTILNEKKESIEVANHPNMKVYLRVPTPLHKWDMMRIKVFDKKDYL